MTASSHLNKLLSTTFPHLCVHPAKRVRQGIIAAIQGILTTCSLALKESRLMLQQGGSAQVRFQQQQITPSPYLMLKPIGKHIPSSISQKWSRWYLLGNPCQLDNIRFPN